MSAYNDFLIKASVGFVDLANKYCNKLSQGMHDCLLENKINLLAMYIDTIPRTYSGNCVTSLELTAITEHINWLLGCHTLGDLTATDIPVPGGIVISPAVTSAYDSYAWNTVVGTTPTVILFDNALGTSGGSWSMTYIAYTADGIAVDPTITDRMADRFTVKFDEEDVHFEGVANQIRA